MVRLAGSKESGKCIFLCDIYQSPSSLRSWQGQSVRITGKISSIDPVENKAFMEQEGNCLLIDTSLLGPVKIQIQTSLYQILGEIEMINDNTPVLSARILRCVDGLDLVLFQKAIKLLQRLDSHYFTV